MYIQIKKFTGLKTANIDVKQALNKNQKSPYLSQLLAPANIKNKTNMRETFGQKKPKIAARQNIVYLRCYYWSGSSLLLLMLVQINFYLADTKFLTLKQLITYT